jgi:hypothetical protein
MQNFDNIFVFTYGQSKSELLMELLNSIEGYVIRGENYNFVLPLFNSYRKVTKSRKKHGGPQADSTTNPWWGVNEINIESYLSDSKILIDNVLVGRIARKPRVFGFKEIRYPWMADILPEFVAFIRKIYPRSGFIFNFRKLDRVMQSGYWANQSKKNKIEQLQKLVVYENAAQKFSSNNKHFCFEIRYEDVLAQPDKLKSLFQFLGEEYIREKACSIYSDARQRASDYD